MIFHENCLSAGRQFSCNTMPYFFGKLGKMSQNLSSVAAVIGALRVNLSFAVCMLVLFD